MTLEAVWLANKITSMDGCRRKAVDILSDLPASHDNISPTVSGPGQITKPALTMRLPYRIEMPI
jgi:hypothetical protein